MINLKELHLTNLKNPDIQCLLDFIERRSKLEWFINEHSLGPKDSRRIGEILTAIRYIHFGISTPNTYRTMYKKDEMTFEFLSKFKNIKKCCTDIILCKHKWPVLCIHQSGRTRYFGNARNFCKCWKQNNLNSVHRRHDHFIGKNLRIKKHFWYSLVVWAGMKYP